MTEDASPQPATPAGHNKTEYKVLTQKDRFFSGKFSPEGLEQAINAYAEQGWRAVSMATASVPGLGNNREELIVLLERSAS